MSTAATAACVPAAANLNLRFVRDGATSRMFVPAQDPPWRVVRAFQNSRQQAVVHLHNVSGGVVSGDSLHLSIEAGEGTNVQVTSVGATRIYRQRPGRDAASLFTSIQVADGATLEYLPDVTIPFSGSGFNQSTDVSLGANAGFIGWEMIAAGRVASGEEFAFDFFNSEVSVCSERRPLAIERWALNPSARDPRSVTRWGRFRYLATLYICHTGATQHEWAALESSLSELAVAHTSTACRWGVSALVESGVVIRGLSLEAHQITGGLHLFWEAAKQQVWHEPAVRPRKIN